MKTKLLLFSALAFVMLCFNGCTPDEVVTAQAQFKPLLIRMTLANPIVQNDLQQGIQNLAGVSGYNCQLGLSGYVPNQVGQSIIEYTTTAVPNTALYYVISYQHQNGTTPIGSQLLPVYQCNSVNFEIVYDGQTVFNETKEMGSLDGTCGDGSQWNVNYTLQ